MGEPKHDDGMDAGIAEDHFDHASGGRIPVEDRLDITSDLLEHARSLPPNRPQNLQTVSIIRKYKN